MSYQRPRHVTPAPLMLGIRYHRDRIILDGGVDIPISVGALSAHGYKYITRLNPPRVVVQAAHHGIVAKGQGAGSPHQFGEVHCLHYRQTIVISMTAIT